MDNLKKETVSLIDLQGVIELIHVGFVLNGIILPIARTYFIRIKLLTEYRYSKFYIY